jgi:N-formylglutamate deformylase
MPSTPQRGAFNVKAPQSPASPLVFDSPHSGFVFPADFQPVATREQIQTTWDAYVDELCAGVVESGASLITAGFPRAYIDANRAVDDIDPEILATPWPKPTRLSEHSARGMGLIRRFALPGVAIYDRRLTVAEVTRRIDDFYVPYRRALQEAIEGTAKRHGAVWHFNCHSMKSRGHAMNRDSGAARPDFVIGDRRGTTAPATFTGWVADFFSRRGFSVRVNKPYQGADIIRAHGDPVRRHYSIQIEINRSLYMHEPTCERHAGFGRVREAMTEFARAVVDLARTQAVH